MSGLTRYNPENLISADTREAIEKLLGEDCWDNYTSNIESKLRMRGEHGLADSLLAEIQQTRDEQAMKKAARERGF